MARSEEPEFNGSNAARAARAARAAQRAVGVSGVVEHSSPLQRNGLAGTRGEKGRTALLQTTRRVCVCVCARRARARRSRGAALPARVRARPRGPVGTRGANDVFVRLDAVAQLPLDLFDQHALRRFRREPERALFWG